MQQAALAQAAPDSRLPVEILRPCRPLPSSLVSLLRIRSSREYLCNDSVYIHILLREIRRKPQDFWKKLNGRPEPLPQPLQRQGQWRQYMSDLCAPATAAVPQPMVAAPAAACQAAEPLNQPITSAEVESALPLLNNNRSGAGQGWPAELLRYAYREVQDEDGKILKFHVLARPLAPILDAAF